MLSLLRAMPRIQFAADGVPGRPHPSSPDDHGGPDGATLPASDELATQPLTSRAQILGNALHSLGIEGTNGSPHLRLGRPRAVDFVPPSVAHPLGKATTDNMSDALSPMIARYLDDSNNTPVQPLGLANPGQGWTGSATEFVFARVRRRRSNEPPPTVPAAQLPGVQRTPAETLSSGEPLLGAARQAMEPVIGTNLGEVRIHRSPAASAMASALSADAFTVGREVFFAEGKFDPFTPRGQALLAHELVHVRQQERSGERVQGHGDHPDAAEAEAQLVERAVLDQSEGTGGQIEVDSLVRRYHTTGGGRMPAEQRERLDQISVQALAVAEQILGPTLAQHAGLSLDSLTVDVELDPAIVDTPAAVQQVGQALATALRRALGEQA